MDMPVFELKLDPDGGVEKISFVKRPAIMRNFFVFSGQKKQAFQIQDEDKRIVTGAVLIPDQLIYRKEGKYEFSVFFSKDTIKELAVNMLKSPVQTNPNHSDKEVFDGVFMFEQFISDSSRGVSAPKGFEDLPDGTLYHSYYVENTKVWDQIKSGEFQGFSIEGLFGMVQHFSSTDNVVTIADITVSDIEDLTPEQNDAIKSLVEVLKPYIKGN